jgi:transcriptional antiterminator RfaH
MKRWYCVNTHPGKETTAEKHLVFQGFETCLPMHRQEYIRAKPRNLPLFTGYLFVAFDKDVDRWQVIRSTFGIKRLFSTTPETPTPVPLDVMESIITHVAPTAPRLITAGCRVRILRGSFVSKEGICSWTDEMRIALLLRMVNSEVEVLFTHDEVRLIPD